MYFMFVIVGAGGLMVTANLKPIAVDWKVDNVPVTLMWMTMTAVTFAATIDRVLNGLTRPFFGWVSDHIGRENTMFIAFFIEGVGIFALYKLGSDPVWFVILSGLVFFAWGEIYSLFPSTCTDTFGTKFATTNAGLLYTAKGTASLLVPYASSIQKATGSWDLVFIIAAGANILAAVLAIAILKPWRRTGVAVIDAVQLTALDTIFGLPGIPITALTRRMQAAGVRVISFRHEQNAGYAASIAGFMTQKPGVCLTVSAPGFLNGLTALANATTNCFPMILISGSSEREIVDLQQGDYEEMDQLAIAKPHAKAAFRVLHAEDIGVGVARAIRAALSGRP